MREMMYAALILVLGTWKYLMNIAFVVFINLPLHLPHTLFCLFAFGTSCVFLSQDNLTPSSWWAPVTFQPSPLVPRQCFPDPKVGWVAVALYSLHFLFTSLIPLTFSIIVYLTYVASQLAWAGSVPSFGHNNDWYLTSQSVVIGCLEEALVYTPQC